MILQKYGKRCPALALKHIELLMTCAFSFLIKSFISLLQSELISDIVSYLKMKNWNCKDNPAALKGFYWIIQSSMSN